MVRSAYIAALAMLSSVVVAPFAAGAAEDFPTRPVTSLGPFGAGGGADTLLRGLADVMEPYLGQPLVHVNKAGGAGTVAGATVATGAPDGYTVVTLVSTGAIPEIYTHFREAPYTSADLRPVIRLDVNPYALWVHADKPWETLDDFIAAAKESPGELTYAHAGRGHIYHLLMTALSNEAGIELRDVPTEGGGPTIQQVLGQHVDAGVASVQSGKKHLEAGTLKMLAVEHSERIPYAPDVPTFAEAGYDFGLSPWYLSTFVHADTPDDVVEKLHDAFKAALEDPKFLELADSAGIFIDYGDAEAVRADVANDREVILPLLEQVGMGPGD